MLPKTPEENVQNVGVNEGYELELSSPEVPTTPLEGGIKVAKEVVQESPYTKVLEISLPLDGMLVLGCSAI